jgi:ferredoxin
MTQAPSDRGFMLHLKRSHQSFYVPPGESALSVLLRNGIDVPWHCRFGTCGSCVTRVLEGTPDHRDSVLSRGMQDSGQFMALCVSRAVSGAVTLDL